MPKSHGYIFIDLSDLYYTVCNTTTLTSFTRLSRSCEYLK